jgi:hypothetical protein
MSLLAVLLLFFGGILLAAIMVIVAGLVYINLPTRRIFSPETLEYDA